MPLKPVLLIASACVSASLVLGACAAGRGSEAASQASETKPVSATPYLPDAVNENCEPGRAASPVVLVHGTFANARRAFKTLAPLLKSEGYCVFALNYGKRSSLPSVYATGDMEASAAEIARFIDDVRQKTGAERVDLIGHSQGGTLALFLGKQAEISGKLKTIVAISPSTRGTQTAKALSNEASCVACVQQSPVSDFIRRLNDGPLNPRRIPTLIFGTDNDMVVTPVASQFVFEPGVVNRRLQEMFPGRFATHSGILHDRDAMQFVVQWLKQKDLTAMQP